MQDKYEQEEERIQKEIQNEQQIMDEEEMADRKEIRQTLLFWITVACCLVAAAIGFLIYAVHKTSFGSENTKMAQISPSNNEYVIVPDITGISKEEAEKRLQEAQIGYRIKDQKEADSPYGTILEQIPEAGAELKRNETIEVVISAGASKEPIPKNVIGQPVDSVVSRLANAGFSTVSVRKSTSSVYDIGCVCRVMPDEGEYQMTSKEVVLTVSCGEQEKDVTCKNYLGISQAEIMQKVQEDGLTPRIHFGNSDIYDNGIVMAQSVEPYMTVTQGTDVILTINSTDVRTNGAEQSWEADVMLNAPSSYKGGDYRLVLVQTDNGIIFERLKEEGNSLPFPHTMAIKGIENVKEGTLYLYERDDSQWTRRAEWKIEFQRAVGKEKVAQENAASSES